MKLILSGWKEGILTISLMKAVRDYTDNALPEAKELVEELIRGEEIELSFPDEEKMNQFRKLAAEYGVLNFR